MRLQPMVGRWPGEWGRELRLLSSGVTFRADHRVQICQHNAGSDGRRERGGFGGGGSGFGGGEIRSGSDLGSCSDVGAGGSFGIGATRLCQSEIHVREARDVEVLSKYDQLGIIQDQRVDQHDVVERDLTMNEAAKMDISDRFGEMQRQPNGLHRVGVLDERTVRCQRSGCDSTENVFATLQLKGESDPGHRRPAVEVVVPRKALWRPSEGGA